MLLFIDDRQIADYYSQLYFQDMIIAIVLIVLIVALNMQWFMMTAFSYEKGMKWKHLHLRNDDDSRKRENKKEKHYENWE